MGYSPLAKQLWAVMERTFQRPDAHGARTRTFHRHLYCMMRCTLTIDAGLPPHIAHGLFGELRRYDGWVRFSSAFFRSERTPDSKGMAVKLLEVRGDTCLPETPGEQDFVMGNTPTVWFGTEALMMEYARQVRRKMGPSSTLTLINLVPPGFLFPGGNPLKARWNVVRLVATHLWQSVAYRDPARYTYFSGTAFRLGDGAMKLCFRPVPTRGLRLSGDYVDRLKQRLAAGPVAFDFLAQSRTMPHKEPLDDATVLWRSPWVKVGRLEIPPQEFDTAERRDLGERISYSPWNCLKAHEPLGGVNVARKLAYGRSAANRGAMCPFRGGAAPTDEKGRRKSAGSDRTPHQVEPERDRPVDEDDVGQPREVEKELVALRLQNREEVAREADHGAQKGDDRGRPVEVVPGRHRDREHEVAQRYDDAANQGDSSLDVVDGYRSGDGCRIIPDAGKRDGQTLGQASSHHAEEHQEESGQGQRPAPTGDLENG